MTACGMRNRSDRGSRPAHISMRSSARWAPIRASRPYDARMTIGDPFLLGVNYWPRRKAMYWWSDFDPGEVREEFALIRELGLHMARIFLLWDDFQPTPDRVAPARLTDLRTVCDIAAEIG